MEMSTASSSTWNCPSEPRTCSCSVISGCRSVVVPRDKRAALADEEVEVRAFVGLLDVVEVQAPVAALERGFRLLPGFFSLGKGFFGDQKLDLSLRGIELDHVAVLHERQHAARGGLRRNMQ